MLMQRVLTAAVLLPLLLAAIWWLPPSALYAVFCAAGLAASWEWAGLMGARWSTPAGRGTVVALVGAGMLLGWLLRAHAVWALLGAAGWWLYAVSVLRAYTRDTQSAPSGGPALLLIVLLLMVPTMLGLWLLRSSPDGALRLLFLFFLVFAADTGAYFAGRRFGRRKLAPAISPGKTVEGLIGGLVLSLVWTLLAGPFVFAPESTAELGALALLCLAVAGFSVVGDLIESMFKRAAGIKDSGNLLPGHGGMLDRVDSILAAAPIFALGLTWLGL